MDSKFLIALLLKVLIHSVLSQRCPNRWLLRPESDSCYRFWPKVTKTWTEAQEICSKYEGTLLKLDSQAEKDWIISQVNTYPPNYEWWLGLKRHGQDDAKWQWTDGSDRNETNKFIQWGSGEPNNFRDEEDCAEIWDNLLNDKNCRQPLQFICERPADLRLLCDVDNSWDVLHQKSCYKYYDKKKTFNMASDECQSQSAALLWISNDDEQKSITDFTQNENTDAVWLNIKKATGNTNPWIWQNSKDRTGTCPTGYLQHKTTCVLENEKSTVQWHEADGFCNLRGTSLLEIKRESDWDWLKTFIKDFQTGTIKSVWLGLTGNDTHWYWGSGTAVGDFEKKMAPGAVSSGQGCGSVVEESGVWETGDCNGYKGVICTVSIDTPVMTPPNMQSRYECPYGYNLAANKCYRAIPGERLDWFRAQERCKNDGGQLATVHTEEQQTYLLGILKHDSWIGLNDLTQEGTYIWNAGAKADTTYWLPKEPYNAVIGGKYSENCVMMRHYPGNNRHGKWRDLPCSFKRNFICELQPERNIALGKWAKQSSNYKYDANKAIDGCTTRSWTKECCTHTSNDFEPWWQLDLATQYSIGKVVIHRRFEASCSSCQRRMRGFRLYITPTSDKTNAEPVFTETRPIPPAIIKLKLPNIVKGRFVTIDIPKRNEYLTLCEVEVFQANEYRVTELTNDNSNCFTDARTWVGNVSHTAAGIECQPWNLDVPHTHSKHEGTRFPSGSQLAAKNYCRDADGEGAPWCYTMDPHTRWDYCGIPHCSTKVPSDTQAGTDTPMSESASDCGRGWVSTPSGSCFQYHNTMLSWADAKTVCSGAGGTLAVPVTEAEQTTIISGFKNEANRANAKVWIGISDTDNTGDDRWESLEGKTGYVDLLRTHLSPGNPTPDHSKCMNLNIGNSNKGSWNLASCLDRSLFACKKLGPYLVVHTGNSKKYIYIDKLLETPTKDRTFIQFDFKGEMGAALRLTNPNSDFEIIIGGNFNTKSFIQVPGESSPKHARLTSKLLSKTDFRPFYVSWVQGKITVGRGTEIGRNVFMTYSALSLTPVFKISVATSEGKEGDWKFKRGQGQTKVTGAAVRTNLALKKPTFQTSTHSSIAKSENAVDGCKDTHFFNKCCTHTVQEFQPWWQVDLGKVYPIEEIVIYRRWECVPCRRRMIGYRVFISAFSDSTSEDDMVYKHTDGQIPDEVVRIPATGRSGRYVKIDIPGRGKYLELCEVEVYQDLNVPKCGEGWKDYGRDETCYQFSTTQLSWQAASTYCKGFGAELTTIKTPEEQMFLYENTISTFQDEVIPGQNIWIGVHDIQSESSFVAIDGNPIIYTDWGKGEPNDYNADEDCAGLRLDTNDPGTAGQWNDIKCSQQLHFVCKKQELPATTAAPTTTMALTTLVTTTIKVTTRTSIAGSTARRILKSTMKPATTLEATTTENYVCKAGWLFNSGTKDCYKQERLRLSWDAARLYCVHMTDDRGATLTSIRSSQEQQFLSDLIRTTGENYWVGAHDSVEEDSWEWVDRSTWWSDIRWAPGNPDDWQTGEDCGMIVNSRKNSPVGALNDAACQDKYGFICRKKATNASKITTVPPTTTSLTTRLISIPTTRKSTTSVTRKPSTTTTATSTPVTTITTESESNACGAGWDADPNSDTCYRISVELLTWQDANDRCLADDGFLLSIVSSGEQSYISGRLQSANLLPRMVWIGTNDIDGQSGWHWSDDSPLAYFNWKELSPQDFRLTDAPRKDCAAMITSDQSTFGLWEDIQCDTKAGYICKKKQMSSTTQPPPASPSMTPNVIEVYQGYRHLQFDFTTHDLYELGVRVTDTLLFEVKTIKDAHILLQKDRTDYTTNIVYIILGGWGGSRSAIHIKGQNVANKYETNLLSQYEYRLFWISWNSTSVSVGKSNTPGENVLMSSNELSIPINYVAVSTAQKLDAFWRFHTADKYYGCAGEVDGWIGHRQNCYLKSVVGCERQLTPNVIEVYQGYRHLQFDFTTHDLYELGVRVTDTLLFEVKTIKDAHILLQKDRTDYTTNIVYIILGGWGGSRSAIHIKGQNVANKYETNLLSQYEYRFFWISWNSTSVSVGKSNTPGENVLMSSNELSIPINYVAVSTAQKLDAFWRFHTADKYYGCVGEDDGWIGHRQNCYLFVQKQKNWNEASKYCRTKGAELASIQDDSEQMMIFSQLPKDNYCFNLYENDTKCNEWAKTGECDRNPVWMTTKCHLACNHCVHNCRDKYNTDKCKDWAERAECSKNPSFMLKNCAQSCGVCQGAPSRGYWIGMYSNRNSRSFEWSDMSDVTYTRWDNHEPTSYKRQTGSCVAVFQQNGNWNDGSCEDPLAGFVCKQSKLVIPRTTPVPYEKGCTVDNSYGYGVYCYTYVNQQKSWTDANQYCSQIGGNLVQIYDKYVQAFVASELGNRLQDHWIGLTIASNTVRWGEQTDAIVRYAHFNKGFDAYAAEDGCFAMTTYRPIGMWKRYDCTSQLPFICQSSRIGFTTTASTTPMVTSPPVPCPATWTGFGDLCFKSFLEETEWSAAQRVCNNRGASLASVHSAQQNDFLFQTMVDEDKLMLGLHDRSNEGSFVWEDGTPFIYSNWNENEPNNAGNEDCIEIKTDGKWNDIPCDIGRGFICQIPRAKALITVPTTTVAPVIECTGYPGWRKLGDYCYYVSPDDVTKTWHDARQFCTVTHGAQLTSIHSTEEMLQLKIFIGSTTVAWVGFNDLDLDNTFQWSDGTAVNFVNWYPGEPNDMNTGEKCVAVLNGQMNDNNCNILRSFVCKRHDGPIVPVTTTPMTVIDGGCQPGFVPYGNKCYLIAGNEADGKTWAQAKDVCITRNSFIASIHSSKEHKFIVSQLYNKTEGLWIGLNNLNGLKQFDWADNSIVDYTNWAVGEPSTNHDDIYTHEPCVEIVNKADSTIYWNDVNCHNRRGYICSNLKKSSIPPPTPPDYSVDCKTGYVLYRNNCYRVIKEIQTWADSQSTCQQDGANLISIMDIYELNFASVLLGYTTVQYPFFWTGGKLYKGTFSWESGETPTFRPNIIMKSGTVTDPALCILCVYDAVHSEPANCDTGMASICKMPAASAITTTQLPTTLGTTSCRPDWDRIGGYCYLYSLERVTFEQASSKCQMAGAQLASVQTFQDNQALVQNLSTKAQPYQDAHFLWIGLSQAGATLEWEDNSVLDFTAFTQSVQPDGSSCVVISQYTTYWYWRACSDRIAFICKIKPDIITTTEPTTTSTHNTSSSTTYPIVFPPLPHVDTSPRKGDDDDSGLTGGQIAGIVIGIIGVLFILGVAVYVIKTNYWKKTLYPVDKIPLGFDNALFNRNQETVTLD